MGRKLFAFIFIISLFLFGCGQKDIRDEEVYLIQEKTESPVSGEELNTEGTVRFQAYEAINYEGRVLITMSMDGKDLFFMEPLSDNEEPRIIKGEPKEKVRIIKVNRETQKENIVAEDIPFISLVQWNNSGRIVAFGGGERLIIYDTAKDRLLLEKDLEDDAISYFFWSPKDENKLYTENYNLSNGSIYYVNSQKKVEAYETKEQIYYKGKLDNNYYFATKWFSLDQGGKNDGIRTLVVDKTGNEVKILGEGRFRDAFQKSLLQIGDNGFGLYYTPDINKPNKILELTKEFVFDAKFVDDGKIAFIVENKNLDKNLFFLYVMDKNGKELVKHQVSGSSIALLPDGKTGYIGGPLWEKINFSDNKIEEDLTLGRQTDSEKAEIFKTIRNAISVLIKFELTGEKDKTAAKQFFLDTYSPDQWAYFDISNLFNDNPTINSNKDLYRLQMELKDLQSHDEIKGIISAVVRVSSFTGSGGASIVDYALELIEKDDNWYVTGLSTFPFSQQRNEVKEIIEEYINDAQEGKIFPGELEDKEVEIGQIQFWASSLPHLAPNVGSADYCKVYLKVKNNGKQEIWKMVLDKKNQSYWYPTKLSRENLSSL